MGQIAPMRTPKNVARLISTILVILVIADVFSHARNLLQLPSNATLVWRVMRGMWLGFTPQALAFLVVAILVVGWSERDGWLPYAQVLWVTLAGRPRTGTLI